MLQTYTDSAVHAHVADHGDVAVTCGVNRQHFSLGGKSVGDIRVLLRQALNLPQAGMVMVNGQLAAEGSAVEPGDEVEFLKEAGVKGGPAA